MQRPARSDDPCNFTGAIREQVRAAAMMAGRCWLRALRPGAAVLLALTPLLLVQPVSAQVLRRSRPRSLSPVIFKASWAALVTGLRAGG